jgi:hypothetical protein
MKTTFVFGAGASIHAGYPLASKMGKQILNFMIKHPHDLSRHYGQLIVDSFGKSPNIEDLITEIDARIESLKNEGKIDEKRVWGNARGWFAVMLREWFRKLHKKPARDYKDFAKRIIKPGDTVITFNYDDSLDRELRQVRKWDLSRGYGFPLGKADAPSKVLMLKLHGSMNWMLSINNGAMGFTQFQPGKTLGDQPVIHREDAKYLGYKKFEGNTYPGGGAAMQSLILPGRCKRFVINTSFGPEYEGFWNALWSKAAAALKESDRLVICGYSMPKADKRARRLLLGVKNKDIRITVICGGQSEDIAECFRKAKFRNVKAFKGGYFDKWLQSLKAGRPRMRSV